MGCRCGVVPPIRALTPRGARRPFGVRGVCSDAAAAPLAQRTEQLPSKQ